MNRLRQMAGFEGHRAAVERRMKALPHLAHGFGQQAHVVASVVTVQAFIREPEALDDRIETV